MNNRAIVFLTVHTYYNQFGKLSAWANLDDTKSIHFWKLNERLFLESFGHVPDELYFLCLFDMDTQENTYIVEYMSLDGENIFASPYETLKSLAFFTHAKSNIYTTTGYLANVQ